MSRESEDVLDKPASETESGLKNNKMEWKTPSLTSFPTQKSEAKDFPNPDEGTFSSGPS